MTFGSQILLVHLRYATRLAGGVRARACVFISKTRVGWYYYGGL